eukprot:scaffold636_cov252-Pinguiococcus_pyrenoidosus.AAC.5
MLAEHLSLISSSGTCTSLPLGCRSRSEAESVALPRVSAAIQRVNCLPLDSDSSSSSSESLSTVLCRQPSTKLTRKATRLIISEDLGMKAFTTSSKLCRSGWKGGGRSLPPRLNGRSTQGASTAVLCRRESLRGSPCKKYLLRRRPPYQTSTAMLASSNPSHRSIK